MISPAPQNVNLTVVKIRGKRHGLKAEKYHTGQRRKLLSQKRHIPSGHVFEASLDASTLRQRKRKRHADEKISALEALPTEVLQQIFTLSLNISLPLASRQLALKLSNSLHLQHQMTSLLLQPVLEYANGFPTSAADLVRATRLLNSRFMTWEVFLSWLQGLPEVSAWANDALAHQSTEGIIEFWSSLRPAPGLLPPKKLLSSPFTDDNARFLAVLSHNVKNVAATSPSYSELAYEGLNLAVQHSRPDVVALLLGMGLESSTELLRMAVADAGCHQDVVRLLVAQPHVHGTTSHVLSRPAESTVDLLDPFLWAWAEKKKESGNPEGEWLMALFKHAQQSRERVPQP